MFGIASRSKPSARTVSTHTSTERSLGYVDSSGDRRRSQRTWALVGSSARSGPSSRSNQRSRSRAYSSAAASAVLRSTLSSSRSEICFSASLRATGVTLAGEAALELVAGDEQLPASLVEARVERLCELAELLALRVVGQDCELRLRRVQRHLVAGERQPRREDRVLQLVVSRRQLGVDDALLARPSQPVEPFALVGVDDVGLGRTQRHRAAAA